MNGDWQSQFASGFASSGSPVDLGPLVWFLLLAAGAGAAWYFYERYQRSRPKAARPGLKARPRYIAIPGKLNPLQQIRIQEMIDEFRKQEPSSQAVPSAVLEKYAEFFYNQVGKMKVSDKEVEAYISQNFALKAGDAVELDFNTAGALHLIKSKVSGVTGRNILVDYQSAIPDFLRVGTVLHLNYSSGRRFLQGHTQILEVRPEVGLILKRPAHVTLTSERRYSRLPLPKASGTLQDTKSDYHASVKVLDLSIEGVRVQVGRPLDKTHLYLLSFEAQTQGRVYPFGPLECVPSKAFLTGSGTYESGLVFLSMTMGTKQKVVAFMKLLAQELQAEKAARDAEE